MAIDTEMLLTEALKKHGIRLDPDDPAVVLVTLNRLVLEDVAKSIAADRGSRSYSPPTAACLGVGAEVSSAQRGVELTSRDTRPRKEN